MKFFDRMTDEELVLLYVRGDNEAFDELLLRNKSKLFSYILCLVQDQDIADDVFQDTFVKVIIKLQEGKYTDCGKFSCWLLRIAHNIIMDRYRHQCSRKIVEPTVDNDLSNLKIVSVTDSSRESQLANEQVLADIRKLMDNLPESQREVVYMRFYQEMSFKEIAYATNSGISTALGRMRYAILNMRRMAKEHNIALELDCV